jgi:peroxiredoxin Q/BCP
MSLNIENKYEVLFCNWKKWEISLKELFSNSDKNILYFYPKDNTPWCTIENKNFSLMKDKFKEKWFNIIWVSKDSIESHEKFMKKQELNVDLISDPNLILHKQLWVYWEKNNYWKIVMWVIRSTFLIDSSWKILKEWKNVKANWHVERLLKEL